MRANFTVFLLFFGISLLDAVRGGNWVRVLFWVVIGLGFLLADRRQLAKERNAGG